MKRLPMSLILLTALAAAPAGAADFGKFKDLLGGFGGGKPGAATGLGDVNIGAGLKEALKIGTGKVVDVLGAAGGFLDSKDVHIPLPGKLQQVQSALKMAGASGLADDLETRLNRAAEAATPQAKEIFWNAIGKMTIGDAQAILHGPQDAATRHFQRTMTPELKTAMQPIIRDQLTAAGAMQAYDQMIGRYREIPFMPDVSANLTDYALDKTLDGIFLYVAREEAAIRTNPAARSTDLLKKVFGALD